MAVSAESAARTLCEMRGWSISNLELQKILFLAHMYHLGSSGGRPLINEEFQAWDYGPVVPSLYRRVRGFGSGAVRNVFHRAGAVQTGTSEYDALQRAAEATRTISPGRLVEETHQPWGSWARHYRSGVRGIRIPNEDILNEFNERAQRARARKAG